MKDQPVKINKLIDSYVDKAAKMCLYMPTYANRESWLHSMISDCVNKTLWVLYTKLKEEDFYDIYDPSENGFIIPKEDE